MQVDTLSQEEAQQLQEALFSTRRPKDIKGGLASGAKSVAKGVLAGGARGSGRHRAKAPPHAAAAAAG